MAAWRRSCRRPDLCGEVGGTRGARGPATRGIAPVDFLIDCGSWGHLGVFPRSNRGGTGSGELVVLAVGAGGTTSLAWAGRTSTRKSRWVLEPRHGTHAASSALREGQGWGPDLAARGVPVRRAGGDRDGTERARFPRSQRDQHADCGAARAGRGGFVDAAARRPPSPLTFRLYQFCKLGPRKRDSDAVGSGVGLAGCPGATGQKAAN